MKYRFIALLLISGFYSSASLAQDDKKAGDIPPPCERPDYKGVTPSESAAKGKAYQECLKNRSLVIRENAAKEKAERERNRAASDEEKKKAREEQQRQRRELEEAKKKERQEQLRQREEAEAAKKKEREEQLRQRQEEEAAKKKEREELLRQQQEEEAAKKKAREEGLRR